MRGGLVSAAEPSWHGDGSWALTALTNSGSAVDMTCITTEPWEILDMTSPKAVGIWILPKLCAGR